jgi:hypothetical protein
MTELPVLWGVNLAEARLLATIALERLLIRRDDCVGVDGAWFRLGGGAGRVDMGIGGPRTGRRVGDVDALYRDVSRTGGVRNWMELAETKVSSEDVVPAVSRRLSLRSLSISVSESAPSISHVTVSSRAAFIVPLLRGFGGIGGLLEFITTGRGGYNIVGDLSAVPGRDTTFGPTSLAA